MKSKVLMMKKYFIMELIFQKLSNDYTKISLYNAFKFEIYDNSLFKPFIKYKIKEIPLLHV